MRRSSIVLSVVAVLVVVLALVPRGGGTIAQENDASGLVGSWRIMVTRADGVSFLTLSTFNADGTTVTVNLPAQPAPPDAPPGMVYSSTALGTWEATGPDTAVVTFVHMRANGEGQFIGTTTPHLAITLGADGESLTGEAVTTLEDPAGNVLATFPSTIEGTRIVAEAPAVATPEA